LSNCTARTVEEQKNCRFYRKSSHSEKCMYLVFDQYCDCFEAQVCAERQADLAVL
jgi:hypothetical protein